MLRLLSTILKIETAESLALFLSVAVLRLWDKLAAERVNAKKTYKEKRSIRPRVQVNIVKLFIELLFFPESGSFVELFSYLEYFRKCSLPMMN